MVSIWQHRPSNSERNISRAKNLCCCTLIKTGKTSPSTRRSHNDSPEQSPCGQKPFRQVRSAPGLQIPFVGKDAPTPISPSRMGWDEWDTFVINCFSIVLMGQFFSLECHFPHSIAPRWVLKIKYPLNLISLARSMFFNYVSLREQNRNILDT